jgi:hypothetical protein
MDWVPGWENGISPDGEYGASGPVNWLTVLALEAAADLGCELGEADLAVRANDQARSLAKSLVAGFYDARRGLYADDVAHAKYSEHSQCLALLSRSASAFRERRTVQRNLFTDTAISRGTVYFTHYLFEACRLCNRMDVFFKRLEFWQNQRKQGFVTSVECPEPSRSDCHAWGAHPLFHYYATLLGIRPTAAGFKQVAIQPNLGTLTSARGTMAHPNGSITVDLTRKAGRLTGLVELPRGVHGTFSLGRHTIALASGRQKIDLDCAH